MKNNPFTVRRAATIIAMLFIAAVLLTQLVETPQVDLLTLVEKEKLQAERIAQAIMQDTLGNTQAENEQAIARESAELASKMLDTLQSVEQVKANEVDLGTIDIR